MKSNYRVHYIIIVWSQLHKEHLLTLEETNQMVRKWVRTFKDGRTNIHDEEQSGRPSYITEDLVHKVDEKVREQPVYDFVVICFDSFNVKKCSFDRTTKLSKLAVDVQSGGRLL